jgi:hypothetical protein
MRIIRQGVIISALALSLALGTTSAFAMDNGAGPTGTRQKDLEDKGYTCTVVGTGHTECTKAGAETYWCDKTGTCEPKPFRTDPGRTVRLPNLNSSAVYSQP